MASDNDSSTPRGPHSAENPETAPTSGRIPTSDILGGGVLDIPVGESLPRQVGKYKIVRQLGRGGMGVVLLGIRDEDQFHTRVAIKLIRRGIDSATDGREVLKRFDLERQVLGALNHPNIARLIDAGQMPEPDGRPYFVMEYVEGESIDGYCDRMQLHTEERLRLFQKVCAAVHHAHQNLVVHRDIKPGNIMVDGKGEPKLMDFGIAKLMNPTMAGVSMATSWDRGPMTLQYASPEQVEGKPINTASDVYALGVLMYELVTGRKPYNIKRRIEDAILHDDPERPSTAVTHGEEVLSNDGTTKTVPPESNARTREGEVTRLKRKLSGDIDNIVLKAMQKSPARRYSSAEAIAADIERHLDGQAVEAAPDSVVYRFSKFARRNKPAVAAAGAVLAAIVLGGAAAGVGWRQASLARDEAVRQTEIADRERDAAVEAKKQEQAAREKAERLLLAVRRFGNAYTRELPRVIAPLEESTPALRALADSALEGLESLKTEFASDIDMQREIASAYALAGRIKGGMRGGNEGDAEQGLKLLDDALRVRREVVKLAPQDKRAKMELAVALVYRGDALKLSKKRKESDESYAEALAIVEQVGGDQLDDPTLARTYAVTLVTRGETLPADKSDEAGAMFAKSLAIRERLAAGQDRDINKQRDVTVGLGRVADWHQGRGDIDLALPLYQRAFDIRERSLTIESNARTQRDVAIAASKYALALISKSPPDLKQAERLLTRALEVLDKLTCTDPSSSRTREDVVRGHADMGVLELAKGNAKIAAEHLQHAIDSENPPPHQRRTAVMQFEMSRVYEKLGDAKAILGDKPGAKSAYQASLLAIREVGTEAPGMTDAEARVAASMKKLGS